MDLLKALTIIELVVFFTTNELSHNIVYAYFGFQEYLCLSITCNPTLRKHILNIKAPGQPSGKSQVSPFHLLRQKSSGKSDPDTEMINFIDL